MNGHENLIPVTQLSPEEARARRSKGGVNSGKARRRKRDTAKLCKLILSLQPELGEGTMDAMRKRGYDPDTDGPITAEMLALVKIMSMAQQGDLGALKMLYDYALIPDMKTQLEREKIRETTKAMREEKAGDDGFLKALSRESHEAWEIADVPASLNDTEDGADA